MLKTCACMFMNVLLCLRVHVWVLLYPCGQWFMSVCLPSRPLRQYTICSQAGSQEAHKGAHMAEHRAPEQSPPTHHMQAHAHEWTMHLRRDNCWCFCHFCHCNFLKLVLKKRCYKQGPYTVWKSLEFHFCIFSCVGVDHVKPKGACISRLFF